MKRKEYLALDLRSKSFLTQEMHRFIAMIESVDRLRGISKSLPARTLVVPARPALIFEGHEVDEGRPSVNAVEFLGRIIYRLESEIDFMDGGGWLQELISILRSSEAE